MAQHRPTKPIGSYPDANMPPPPPIGAPGEEAPEPKSEVAPASAAPAERAVLQFLDPAALTVDVPLDFPFRYDGRDVRSIILRRLCVAEVGALMAKFGEDGRFDVFDFFAAMSDLPAAVLRGLIDSDGTEVLAKARPLLPRSVQVIFNLTEANSPTADAASAPGAASP